MAPLQDFFTLVVVAVLVAISFATVVQSRRATRTFTSYSEYLFQPRGRLQSIASNVGAVFSLTGFFGATFIYALVLGGPIQIIVGIVFLVLAIVVTRMVRRIDAERRAGDKANILLDYLQSKLQERDFRAVTTMYSIIYFALLFEELAVSRLVLYELLGEPVIVAMLIALITFVVYTYVYFGGFRAVVTADAVQVVVLIAFAASLVLLIVTVPSTQPAPPSHYDAPTVGNLAGALVFGLCWFFAALDFYSRLNFPGRAKRGRTSSFIFVSYALTFVFLLLGTMFGRFMAGQLQVARATSYARNAIDFFLRRPPLVTVIFIAGLFSMIFTTLDTLMLVNLQVGYYQARRWFRRETLLNIVVVAILLSTRLGLDATSLSGIFIGSLFVFPSLAIARLFWPRLMGWLPASPRYLVVAMAAATVVFLALAPLFVPKYDRHFYCALLTFASAAVLGIPWRIVERIVDAR